MTGDAVSFSRIDGPTEASKPAPRTFDPPDGRVAFALVGLGCLTLDELLPAMLRSRHCRLAALVSGDRDKALEVARQHGLGERAVYDYRNFDSSPTIRRSRSSTSCCRTACMIAYRCQYEAHMLALGSMLRQRRLGEPREFVSSNSQAMGDPSHWRLVRSLAA